jgi:low temperature requirement protein LtrA
MMEKTSRGSLLRSRDAHEARVGNVELFFDLVFVFAVTQLSHGLIGHLSPLGAAQTALLLLAVWWVWIYTTWVTNWLDVERTAVRGLLFALMAAGLLLAMSIPQAFAGRGLVFAGTYAAMQIGRGAFMLAALRRHDADNHRNFMRITIWAIASAPFWIAGGLAHEVPVRMIWWGAALAIEYAGPLAAFWVPGLGRTATTSWTVEGHHIAERCGLFVIIALGESVLITGATFAEVQWTAATAAAFASAFLGTIAMWWIYFNIGAERGTEAIVHHDDPGRMARMAYTYLHLPIVAGIIVSAAVDELVLAHPAGHADSMTLALIVGGPALYLAGNLAFKRTSMSRLPFSHLLGLGLLVLLAIGSRHATPLAQAIGANAILILVAVWEMFSFRRGPLAARDGPSPAAEPES